MRGLPSSVAVCIGVVMQGREQNLINDLKLVKISRLIFATFVHNHSSVRIGKGSSLT